MISSVLSQTTPLLQANQSYRTNELLSTVISLLNKTENSVTPVGSSIDSNYIPVSAVISNALLFFSLALSLLAALAAMLVKQWARQYELGLGDQRRLSKQKARKRAFRHHGLRKYHFSDIVMWIPMILHAALVLFFVGIIPWLYMLHAAIMAAVVALLGVGALIYLGTAIIPTFQNSAPFIWPMSFVLGSLLRPVIGCWSWTRRHVAAATAIAHDSNLASPNSRHQAELPPKYIPSYYSMSDQGDNHNTKVGQESIDVYLLTELLEHTDLNEDIDAVLDALRLSHPVGVDDNTILVERESLILHRCRELAESCWEDEYNFEMVRSGFWARSVRLCRFIEWYYYQLSVNERRMMGEWPKDTFAQALYKDATEIAIDRLNDRDKPFDDSIFEDMVLAYSTMSKLHHVRLKEGEVCTRCWTTGSLLSRDTLVEMLRTHEFTEDPNLSHGKQRGTQLVSSMLASNADCLVNYCPLSSHEAYLQIIGPSVLNQASMLRVFMDPGETNYRTLRLYLIVLKAKLSPVDPRVEFFTSLENACKENGQDSGEFKEILFNTEANTRRHVPTGNQRTLRAIRVVEHFKG